MDVHLKNQASDDAPLEELQALLEDHTIWLNLRAMTIRLTPDLAETLMRRYTYRVKEEPWTRMHQFFKALRTSPLEAQKQYWETEPMIFDESGKDLGLGERCRFVIEHNEPIKTTVLIGLETELSAIADHWTMLHTLHRAMEAANKSASSTGR